MKHSSSDKLWQGRSSGDVADITVEIGQSIDLDIQLYREDIQGSRAHARMLEKIGVLNREELDQILEGLTQVEGEIAAGQMNLRWELEDIHTHVENRLIELIGDPARKLHTARSRNDQVAVDTHLFVKKKARALRFEILDLCRDLLAQAEKNIDITIPAYTHLQVAQPARLAHPLMAHFWSFFRDAERLQFAFQQADRLPLGSGACLGVNYDTDREFLREELKFASIYENSMDAVASRDHILNFLYAISVFGLHASRIAEEIILWCSVEFSFLKLPDSVTTGSSIMPQKKNPDLAELIRGKTGRLNGNLVNMMTALKGLPLAYNRDLQEDRQPLLDSAYQAQLVVRSLRAMVQGMEFQGQNMQQSLEKGFATATDLADALVWEKQVPFREAHHAVGKLVAICEQKGHSLTSIPASDRGQAHPAFADDSFYGAAVDPATSADRKRSQGGTARFRIQEQLDLARKQLEDAG
ncbi:MAG: argininosuccinate lyase [Leptospiraceae bacterium]|nr:argininosuccinate lyase [Leptospiraceae bacterium]